MKLLCCCFGKTKAKETFKSLVARAIASSILVLGFLLFALVSNLRAESFTPELKGNAYQAKSCRYQVVNLGGLDPNATDTKATDINRYGEVVGGSFVPPVPCGGGWTCAYLHGFLWQEYQMQDLGTLPGDTVSNALGINDNGEVVGYSSGSFLAVPCAMFNGVMLELPTFGGTEGMAQSINTNQQIVGWTKDSAGYYQATVWSSSQNGLLGSLASGVESSAQDINNAGVIVGWSATDGEYFRHAFRWDAQNGMTDLGVLDESDAESFAYALNDQGYVVGKSRKVINGTAQYRAVLWNPAGVIQDLGTVSGVMATAFGINNQNQVVGQSDTIGTLSGKAFIYQAGVIRDLNLLIPASSGWELNAATAINDRGEIVGFGSYHGSRHGFLLKPNALCSTASSVPEMSDRAGPDKKGPITKR